MEHTVVPTQGRIAEDNGSEVAEVGAMQGVTTPPRPQGCATDVTAPMSRTHFDAMFPASIRTLRSMGFVVDDTLRDLLQVHKGSVGEVVSAFL